MLNILSTTHSRK